MLVKQASGHRDSQHDDVIKWKHFPRYWPFVRGIHRLPVNSPHKGQWRRALMFSLICTWINSWVNNHEAGDLRCHHTHYDVIVMGQVNYIPRWAVLQSFDDFFCQKTKCWTNNELVGEIDDWPSKKGSWMRDISGYVNHQVEMNLPHQSHHWIIFVFQNKNDLKMMVFSIIFLQNQI